MKKILVSSGLVAVLGVGTGVTGIASAGASSSVQPSARVTVPETVLGHPGRATFKVRPRTIVELRPGSAEVIGMQWPAWSGGGARGNGTFTDVGQRGGGVPCRVVLSRVRSGHFTRMKVTQQTSPKSPRTYRWSSAHDDWR
jgi:hypothetical protein